MKRFTFVILFLTTFFNVSFAQKDVTKFLGIPVDGYKTDMIKSLENKGYVYNETDDCLYGEFNGHDVSLRIGTNNNKVWRIMVADQNPSSEIDIKIRFNNLFQQFSDNKKYSVSLMSDGEIPENEDINYEMLVNKKRYQAAFHQKIDTAAIDTLVIQQRMRDAIFEKFTQEQIENPTEEEAHNIKVAGLSAAIMYEWELLEKKMVWFTIGQIYGNYYLYIYYDNIYNKANGEDL